MTDTNLNEEKSGQRVGGGGTSNRPPRDRSQDKAKMVLFAVIAAGIAFAAVSWLL